MASGVTHVFLPLVMGKAFHPEEMGLRFGIVSILCSTLPDMDHFGLYFGIPYGAILGCRGFTHSLLFAALLSLLALRLIPKDANPFSGSSWKLWAYFFFLSSSHGLLDAMTHGGLGVAFLAPFDPTRYFLPWRPLKVSALGLRLFFNAWGGEVSLSEITWIWIPSLVWLGAMKSAKRLYPGWTLREARGVEG